MSFSYDLIVNKKLIMCFFAISVLRELDVIVKLLIKNKYHIQISTLKLNVIIFISKFTFNILTFVKSKTKNITKISNLFKQF